jgi:hypothetical protein
MQVDRDSIVKIRLEDKGGFFHSRDSGGSSSIGATASGQKIDERLKFESPKLSLKTAWTFFTGEGGSADFRAKLIGNSGAALSLIILGALLIAGGVVILIWFKSSIGWALIAAGITLIVVAVVVDQYPWVLLIVAVVGLGAVAYFLYSKYFAVKAKTVLTQVVDGGEEFKALLAASQTFAQDVKDEILAMWKLAHSTAQDKATQAAVKAVK